MPVSRKPGPGQSILKEALEQLDKKVVKIGWFGSAKYPNGMKAAQVAAIQELGIPEKNIPPRPTGRNTIAEYSAVWCEKTNAGAKLVLQGKMTIDALLENIGQLASGNWRKSISKIKDPILKTSTIDARTRKTAAYQNLKKRSAKHERLEQNRNNPTFTKPLVETGYLMNSLTYVIENKK